MSHPRPAQPATGRLVTDVVLEGGGVKGVALAGALQPFGEAGYTVARVGGTSAGALVGAVLAALVQRGEPVSRLVDVARTLDFTRFPDRGFPGRYLGPLGFVADGLSVLLEDGAYEGAYLRRWLSGVLGDLGVSTFGDLRTDDPDDDGTVRSRHRLAVTATDLSRRRLVYLPWDYADYGLDPDEQLVVDAVRASASIPYFFEPVHLTGPHGTSTLVDGAIVSNYPISMFDREDGRPARWPTVGVRVGAVEPRPDEHTEVVAGPVELGAALVATAIEGCQAEHVTDPCNLARTVSVDASDVGTTEFDIDARRRDRLIERGREAGVRFLRDWDYDDWTRSCRPATGPQSGGRSSSV
jgi:NTE family protein